MIPVIRPFEIRQETDIYSPQEFNMISGQLMQLQNMVEPIFKAILNGLTIRYADRLMNGAPN